MCTPWNTGRGRKRDLLPSKAGRRLTTPGSACALWWGRSSRAKRAIRRSNSCGARSRKRASMRRGACLKFLTASWMWTARCAGALAGSLIDLGDGVVCCEFHAKMNAIGADLIAMLHKGLKRLTTDFDAMVIANEAVNFSVGANLMLVLVAAQEQEWDEVHMAVKQFQNVNLALKYAPKPVVAAPQGMALGGGCEIGLHT